MRSSLLHLASTFLVLGCSTTSGNAFEPAQDSGDTFAPIQFGDDSSHAYDVPLLPGSDYDPDLPGPDTLLGRPWGSRLAGHAEILAALRSWAAASPRAEIATFGETYEGRELVRVVITSPENHERLDRILADLRSLWDPRGLSDADAERIVGTGPALAWMGYGIHGDETSASDAAPLVAYHLIACRDASVSELLERVVVVLDPCLNPDGRERIRAMTEWNAGYRTNLNDESLHRGRWPFGRGNHYLFDMNRDWMTGVCPETRARWSVLRDFPPQLFVDAHEMSGLDTFLFYPQAKPHNPELPAGLFEWQERFAADASRAFDALGWGYYTREWADAWYPGYSDAWGSLHGAIGMLYEQGGVGGQPLQRASGEIVPYREAVHGQVVASLANLGTLSADREAILRHYLDHRRAGVDGSRDGAQRAFVFTDTNADRTARFVGALLAQGIEVFRATAAFEATEVVTASGERVASRELPAGTWIVPATQPQAALVRTYLDLDPRIDDETVRDERERLENGRGSRLYDVTAWDLARQLDLRAAWCDPGNVALEPAGAERAQAGGVTGGGTQSAYAWAIDGGDDRSLRFVVRALELGLAVHASDESFSVRVDEGGQLVERELPRGSFLVRRHENGGDVDALVERAARDSAVHVLATSTGRGVGNDPDLGGGHFHLLARPRVALVAGEPTSPTDFGHLWHYLDVDLGMSVTLLEARDLGSYDLRRYNVLVLPPAYGLDLESHADDLRAWVRSGGTLIACGSSAAAVASSDLELTSVVRRRDVLDELDEYDAAARRANAARDVDVDFEDLWGDGGDGEEDGAPGGELGDESSETGAPEESDEGDDTGAELEDEWARRFMPGGVLVRALVDEHHWLTAGAGAEMAVPFSGSTVLLSTGEAPLRLAAENRLRMGGLLWPEARARMASSAWATRDGAGSGQVVLFVAPPVFRGSFRATARLFGNAVVLGPGLGADFPRGW